METILQQLVVGLTNGMVFALIALGYTMVYGILELINFAHGDVFMLASFLALTLCGALGLSNASTGGELALGLALIVVVCAVFAAGLNWSIDRIVYKPLRKAPKLAPLVSAIGVSFALMNIGLFWGAAKLEVFGYKAPTATEQGVVPAAAASKTFPSLFSNDNLLGPGSPISLTATDVLVIVSSLVVMIALFVFVKRTKLGKAMRATAQNPTAARLMGIDIDRVIGATFLIGGGLGGFGAVVYSIHIKTISFQMGYQSGLYAFTAAVLGGIGNIPGAVVGGLVIGLMRAVCDQFLSPNWQPVVVFGALILILVFRPAGIFGSTAREKV